MICDICGQDGTKIRHITRSYGKKTNLFLIENIPVVSCPHCGESYLTAETLYEIERIKLHRKNFKVKQAFVPVFRTALLTAVVLFSIWGRPAFAGECPKQVLMITSYHHGDSWDDAIVSGVQETFDKHTEPITLFIEHHKIWWEAKRKNRI